MQAAPRPVRPNPVWLVRSRQIGSDLRYWLILTGYDRNDRSFSQKIYMVYAGVFFTLWGMAMLSFLSHTARQLLVGLGAGSVLLASSGLLSFLVLIWWLYELFLAGRRSPLAFSEDDAALICLTPVSRRQVAFAWLVGVWPLWAALLGAVAVVMAFAITDTALAGNTTAADIPHYLLAGWRSLVVVVPLVGGMQSLAWAFGCLRLQGDREQPHLSLIPAGAALILVSGLLLSGSLIGGLAQAPWNVLLAPLTFPLAASFGADQWLAGLLAALAWAGVGALALWLAAAPLNLSRAGQETTRQVARQNAMLAGVPGATEQMDLQERLGIGHSPALFSAGSGWRALVWKNLVRTERRGGWAFLSGWLLIFLTGLGAVLVPDWGGRGWALLVWASLVCQQSARYLQNDLSLWPLFRTLPVRARTLLLVDLALPAALATLLAWIALLGGAIAAPAGLTVWAALAVPGLALALGAASAVDMLRNARSQYLIAGQAAAPGGVSLALAAALLALLVLVASWLAAAGLPVAVACFTALLLSLLAARGLLSIAEDQLKGIK
jgi:hypothetical protein